MKNSIRDLLQEKKLEFNEGANLLICLLRKMPKIRNKFTSEWFGNGKEKERMILGIVALSGTFILEFVKKILYAIVFVYVPYILLGKLCPNVLNNQEKSIIYFFIIMTTLCGSIINNTVFTMSDQDYMMLRVFQVNANIHYLGRIVYKMITEFVYFIAILMIFGVSFKYSIAVSFVTMVMRPIGECISLLIYDNASDLYRRRGSINGLIMSAAFIIAYILPYVNRTISNKWYKVSNPYFLFVMLIICAGAMQFLWSYKKYDQISRDYVYIRREEKI